jgi:pyruvate-formate lyase-activating enzyme
VSDRQQDWVRVLSEDELSAGMRLEVRYAYGIYRLTVLSKGCRKRCDDCGNLSSEFACIHDSRVGLVCFANGIMHGIVYRLADPAIEEAREKTAVVAR